MAPPMCWQSTRSWWWSPLGGWPSWLLGWWTYSITQCILHQSTSTLQRKCSSTFLGRSTISAALSAGADVVERVKSNYLLLFTSYMYVCIFSIHRQWDRFCVGRRYSSGSWTDWMMLNPIRLLFVPKNTPGCISSFKNTNRWRRALFQELVGLFFCLIYLLMLFTRARYIWKKISRTGRIVSFLIFLISYFYKRLHQTW